MKAPSSIILICVGLLITTTTSRSFPADSLSRSPKGRVNLSGPRFGASLVKGDNANRLKETFDVNPIVSQFGWQFETRFLSTPDGFAGLSEWIPLVAGVDQGVLLPSLCWLIGFRTAKGTEIGFGPNVSLAGVGLVLAGGITLQTATLNFPINAAATIYKKGLTITLLVGFNAAE